MGSWTVETWLAVFTAATAVFTLLAAIGSLLAARVSLKAVNISKTAMVVQAKSLDADMSLRLAEIIQHHSDQLEQARGNVDRYFSVNHDWINALEVLCHLMNEDLVQPGAKKLVEPVVVDVLRDMYEDQDKRKQLAAAISGPTALDQICLFAERQCGDLKPLGDFLKS